jgi:hypothetical protein
MKGYRRKPVAESCTSLQACSLVRVPAPSTARAVYSETSGDDDSLIHHLSVERPCGDRRLWDSLAAVLKLGSVVLYFPGGPSPLVAAESVIADLPPDMVESLGTPVRVGSGDEILRHIEAA